MDDFVRLIPSTTTPFLEVRARVSPKVTTNGSFRGKQISKISFFEAIILKQNERMKPKYFAFLMILEHSVNSIISRGELRCFNQSSYQQFFKGKQTSTIKNFWCYYSQTKTEECDRRNLYFSVDFGKLMSWANSDLLEVNACVSLK